MASVDTSELVERIWARDTTVWTGRDESRWLGWLDEPSRQPREQMQEAIATLLELEFSDCVLLGMGGSSLAPEVLRRSSGAERFHVLDTTHPAAVRALEERIDLERTLFVASSKSGTTLETRCHVDYFWRRGRMFAAVTDPGSELEQLAQEREFAAVIWGEPTIGGRYSALSPFGLVPAALMGIDVSGLVDRAVAMQEACHEEESPGLELGLELGDGWRDGRDKVLINPNPGGFGLWVEQLIAESTGKQGKGLVPVPSESSEGPDRQNAEVRVADWYDLGAEFYRWEFATAVAGSILGVNPFDQPNVQEAKDRTNKVLSGERGFGAIDDAAFGSLDELLGSAEPPEYLCIQAFIDPAREPELDPLIARARETGCAVTHGLGPRYLHSTGQLHKGGPPTGRFIQVVDDHVGDVGIPNRPFTFGTLIAAQMVGDAESLKERGRPIVRINLEEVA